MKDINIIRTSNRSADVYIDGERQRNIRKVEIWLDPIERSMKFRIETGMDDGHTYAQVFTDFTLHYGDRPYEVSNDCTHVHGSSTPDERIREAWGSDANFDPSIHPVAGEEPDAFDCEHAHAARTCGCGFCRALNRESAKGNSGGYQYSARVPFNFYDAMFDGGNVSKTTRTLIDQLRKRDAKGREKYGTSLDRKDLSLVDWLQHQTEELLDGAGYAQAAKREAERLLEIKKLAHELMNSLQPKDCSDYVRDIGRRLHQALLP
jgi:hypothetical protein